MTDGPTPPEEPAGTTPPTDPYAYGQPAYGQPAYGQPAYGQMPPGQFAAPERTRKRLWWWIAGGVVGLLVLGGIVGAVNNSRDTADQSFGNRSLTLPGQTGDYVQYSGSVADRLIQTTRDGLSSSNTGINAAAVKIGFYTKGSGAAPTLTFLGGKLSESGTIGKQKPSAIVDSVLTGNRVQESADVDAGSLGGVMRCGKTETRCAWADDSTFGDLIFLSGTPAEARAAALQFRKDAEK